MFKPTHMTKLIGKFCDYHLVGPSQKDRISGLGSEPCTSTNLEGAEGPVL